MVLISQFQATTTRYVLFLFTDLVAGSVLDGLKTEMIRDGKDLGAEEAPVESVVAEAAPEAAAEEAQPEA